MGSTLGYLYHDAMKERSVIITFLYEFDEVVSVEWCLIVKANYDVARVVEIFTFDILL